MFEIILVVNLIWIIMRVILLWLIILLLIVKDFNFEKLKFWLIKYFGINFDKIVKVVKINIVWRWDIILLNLRGSVIEVKKIGIKKV